MIRRRFFMAGAASALLPAIAWGQTAPAMPDDNTKVIQITDLSNRRTNLRTLADKAGYTGQSPASFAFVVPAKTNILGASGGGHGIDTGEWPKDAQLWLIVDGNVYGGGGDGGNGGDIPGASDGGRGGDAIFARAPIHIIVTGKGSLKAGGGGGAGANGGGVGGSGGGGGFPNGREGEAGSASNPDDQTTAVGNKGRIGTIAGGGAGGSKGNPGGNGGNAGMAGQSLSRSGGGAGNAVRKNDHAVKIVNYGQIIGESY
ncbi:hypothetical protein OVA03_15630 [Asticcacaulis sp. SL142]|uniref:hypothetical protein n=1 Tax=Asticcacaulis sp. SL142 TaxID=2995155 RepID=UPI00226CA8FF|nr:hypothetical protein [Asticcacaulis sp. SL142]WAC48105.1 hypothetical protein OVA03_15630 [Asticcacaulis sp. SL142]